MVGGDPKTRHGIVLPAKKPDMVHTLFKDELKEKQLPIWNNKDNEKIRKLNQTIDELRYKYDNQIIQRSSFLHSKIKM